MTFFNEKKGLVLFLVLGLKKGLVECATLCVKSDIILSKPCTKPCLKIQFLFECKMLEKNLQNDENESTEDLKTKEL